MRYDRHGAADPLRAGRRREGVRSAIRDEGRNMSMMEGESERGERRERGGFISSSECCLIPDVFARERFDAWTQAHPGLPENRASTGRHHPRPGAG
jgi:hypothetical protein